MKTLNEHYYVIKYCTAIRTHTLQHTFQLNDFLADGIRSKDPCSVYACAIL